MYGDNFADKLLLSKELNDPNLPQLRPLTSKTEDYHFARGEFEHIKTGEYINYMNEVQNQDWPNLVVPSSIHYKFRDHGESSKSVNSHIGKRVELTDWLQVPAEIASDIEVYKKRRFSSTRQITAQTLVIKSPQGTIRI